MSERCAVMPTPAMLAVRPVNLRIGNLRRHVLSRIDLAGSTLMLDFSVTGRTEVEFRVQLGGVLGFLDRGAVLHPLTAGIVWAPAAAFGRALAARRGRDPATLLELRLDFEDSPELVSRFNAVAETIRLG